MDRSGLILLAPYNAGKGSLHRIRTREALFEEGFKRMGWPSYDASCVRHTETGKPYYGIPEEICFNNSDTKGFCGAAFAPCAVGMDLEIPRGIHEALFRRLAPQEQQYLSCAADEMQKKERFARLWTAKEAYCKMTGSGLTKNVLARSFVKTAEESCIYPENKEQNFAMDGVCRPGEKPEDTFFSAQAVYGDTVICVCTAERIRFRIAFLPEVR